MMYRFLIIYEDFEDYVTSYKHFKAYEDKKQKETPDVTKFHQEFHRQSSADPSSVSQSQTSPDTLLSDLRGDSPDEVKGRGGSTVTEVGGGGHADKERATVVAGTSEEAVVLQEDEEKKQSFITPAKAIGEVPSVTSSSNFHLGNFSQINQTLTPQPMATSKSADSKPSTTTRVSYSVRQRIYIPKALCLLSRYPFYDYYSEIIEDLYMASKNHMINILEAYVNKLVLECPAPPRGLAKVKLEKYSKPGRFMELTQPRINELPYVNRSFFDILFRNMTVENVVQIFTHLLVERPVIIVGNAVENMLPIVTSLSALIHPFEI